MWRVLCLLSTLLAYQLRYAEAMATGTLVSLEEYLSTTYDPDCEYVDGELLERNMGEFDHAGVQGIILALLYNQRRQYGIYVFPELRVQVAARRYRIPDITVTTRKGKGRILREPPFLCIEVLSPEDRANRIETKIDDYLNFGVKHIWIIDPREKKGWSYTHEGKREPSEVLTTSDPHLTLSLSEIFAELSESVEE
jgi:Uma2 family endonuclease